MKVAPRALASSFPGRGISVRREPPPGRLRDRGHEGSAMNRIKTTELAAHTGEHVLLRGWLHQFRELGKINFLIVRDGWGTAQAVVEDPAALEALRAVQVESVIEVRGVVA